MARLVACAPWLHGRIHSADAVEDVDGNRLESARGGYHVNPAEDGILVLLFDSRDGHVHSSEFLTLGQMVVLTETQFMVSALPVEGMQTRQMTSRVLERALF